MDTPMNRAFMPLAYSLLLLRQDGHPCVFFGDIYGLSEPFPEPPSCGGKLPSLCLARKLYAYGEQTDYFERSDCIGWVRHGTRSKPHGMAVVLSWTQSTEGEELAPFLRMSVGRQHVGEIWTDLLGFEWAAVVIDEEGFGTFPCQPNSMACFVSKNANGRDRFPVHFDSEFPGSSSIRI